MEGSVHMYSIVEGLGRGGGREREGETEMVRRRLPLKMHSYECSKEEMGCQTLLTSR